MARFIRELGVARLQRRRSAFDEAESVKTGPEL